MNGKPAAAELHQAWRQKMNARAARARASAMRGATPEGTQNQVNSAGALSITNTTTPNGAVWTPLGPAPALTAAPYPAQYYQSQDYGPAVGRITTVVVDPSDPTGNTLYIGGATGGLWKSTNAADPTRSCSSTGSCTAPNVTWTPLIDSQPSLTVGAMAVQPSNSSLLIVGTGEANSSADSYYGQGFLRSIDGGANWTSISTAAVNGSSTDLTGIGFLKIAFSTDNTNVVVAAGASSSVGPQTGTQQSSDNRLGLYYSLDSGASWTRATVTDGSAGMPDPGSATDVIYNHAAGKFFAALRFHGIYSSSDGVNWTKLANQPPPAVTSCTPTLNRSCNFYRAALAIVPGRNEMYAFIVNSADADQGIYQTLDGGTTWTQVPTASTLDNCTNLATNDGSGNGCGTDQGSYNLTLAAIPNGTATDLYAGAINEYKCTLTGTPPSAPTCSFVNLTRVYGCQDTSGIRTGANVHPDEHAIAFVSDATHPIYFGNDGGIYRVLTPQNLADNCPAPNYTRVGASLFDNLDANMGSMLQFVSFSQNPSDDTVLFGGTQDNGTPKKDSRAALNPSGYGYLWGTAHIGDGGFTDINPANGDWFASYANLIIQRCDGTAQPQGTCIDADFPYDPTHTIDSTNVSGDATTFYPVYMLDPGSVTSSATTTQLVLGTCRIWRGNSDSTPASAGNPGWSPGVPISNNFDTNSNSICSGSAINFISALAVGGPTATTAAGLTVSKVLYAGTEGFPTSAGGPPSGGQLFVTFSADTAAAGGVGPGTGWINITAPGAGACTSTAAACNINPGHYNISGIAVDPADATGRTAYVTVMGFHVAHVLKTTDGGATWAALDGDANNGGLPDAPADSVAVHPNIPGQIYVGSDIGVFVYDPVQKAWSEVAPMGNSGFLPNVAVTRVGIFNSGGTVKLRASTYGRGIWETPLPAHASPDFVVSVSPLSSKIYPGQSATFSGSITYFYGYNSPIVVTCTGARPPATCNAGSQLPAGTTSFSVTVSDTTPADYDFDIQLAGQDGTTHSIPVVFRVVDFYLGVPYPASVTVQHAGFAGFRVPLAAAGSFSTTISASCTRDSNNNPLPTGLTCTPDSTSYAPTLAAPGSAGITFTPDPTVPVATYNVVVDFTTADGQRTKSLVEPVTVTLNPNFFITVTPSAKISLYATQKTVLRLDFSADPGGYTGGVSLSCGWSGDGAVPACGWSTSPSGPFAASGSIPSIPATLYLLVDAASASGGSQYLDILGVGASDPSKRQDARLQVDVMDFLVSLTSTPLALFQGTSVSTSGFIRSMGNYAGTVTFSCVAEPGVSCNAPAPLSVIANSVPPVAVTLSAPAGTSAADRNVTVTATDASLTPPLTHTFSLVARVQDFQYSVTPAAATIKAGQTSQHTISVQGQNNLSAPIDFSISGCPSTALMTCTLSPNGGSLNSSTPSTFNLTILTTAATATLGAPPLPRRGSPLFAFWLGLPAIALGLVGVGSAASGAGAPPNSRGRLFPRGSRWTLLAISALALLMVLAACGGGGGGGGSTPPPTPQPGTPAGSYTITVTATAGSGANTVTHSQTINLTVQ
ncbi:MAG TPA: sialidase family protein [Terriglobales bacterium]|nr:sialidase family protein [Terriglobales bacterium]